MPSAHLNRLTHLQAVEDDYPSMVLPWVSTELPRWLAVRVARPYDDHAEYGCQLYEDRGAALEAFAHACASGEGSAPSALYDLDTGVRFALHVSVTACEPGPE